MDTTVGMILAAGFGTRLKELTVTRPKPLMEIGTKAIIYHQIRMLEKAGIKDIYINTHYLSEVLVSTILSWNMTAKLHFSHEESILGTAGGVRQVLNKFDINQSNMILLHGDMICDIDLRHSFNKEIVASLVIAKNRTLDGYKGGVFVDEKNTIVELGSYYRSSSIKREGGFFTGIHYLSRNALSAIRASSYSCLVSELYPKWLHEGLQIKGLVRPLLYDDLGTPARLLESNLALCSPLTHFEHYDFLAELKKHPHHALYLGSNTTIDPTAIIKEPVIIGDGVVIDAHATVGPYAVIGSGARVKRGASVSRSLVLADTIIEKDEQLDCIIALSKARVLEGNIKDQFLGGISC